MNKQRIYLFALAVLMWGCNKAERVGPYQHFWNPTTFTPNGDGLNDSYNPIPHAELLFTDYHIIIFDDNLQTVFESDNKTEHWFPSLTNPDLPTGFYEFQITYTCSEDSVNYYDYITSSKVNLIR